MPRKWTVRTYLLVMGMGLLVPLIIVITYSLREIDSEHSASKGMAALDMSQIMAGDTERMLAGVDILLERLVSARPGKNRMGMVCRAPLPDIYGVSSLIDNTLLLDARGDVRCSREPVRASEWTPWFSDAEHQSWRSLTGRGKDYISQVERDTRDGHWRVLIQRPVFDTQTQRVERIVLMLDLTRFAQALRARDHVDGSELSVYDQQGRLVVSTYRRLNPGVRIADTGLMRYAATHLAGVYRGSAKSAAAVRGFSHVGDTHWLVVADMAHYSAFSEQHRIVLRNSILIAVLLILALSLATLIGKRISAPLEILSEASRTAVGGNLNSVTLQSAPYEIRQLGMWYNELLASRRRAEALLSLEKERAQLTLGTIDEAVITLDTEGVIIYLNVLAEEITGWNAGSALGLAFNTVFDTHPALDLNSDTDEPSRDDGLKSPDRAFTRLRRCDGSHVEIEYSVASVPGEDRRSCGTVVNFRDISQRLRTERALRASNAQLSAIWDGIAEGILLIGLDGMIISVNPAALSIYKVKEHGLVGQHISALLADGERAFWDVNSGDGPGFAEKRTLITRGRHLDGEVFDMEVTLSPSGLRETPGCICIVRDITERLRYERALLHQAMHDHLTGLPNRSLLNERLLGLSCLTEPGTREGTREGAIDMPRPCCAVFCIDLDRFKHINDTLGHEVGDALLVEISERLRGCVEGSTLLARQGGDEFVVVLEGDVGESRCSEYAQRMLDAIAPPCFLDGQAVYVTGSIGIARSAPGFSQGDQLLVVAFRAMYKAKARGGNRYQYYFHDEKAPAPSRQWLLESKLRYALERGEFQLQYQPQYGLDKNTVVGFEALLRWQDKDEGLIAPGEFVHLLEETGLIVPVGKWILFEACTRLARLQAAGHTGLRMAVNLSPRQFMDDGLVGLIADTVSATGIEAQCLEVELTEGMLMEDADGAARSLFELRELGVRVSVDDFGTGYSSLNYLKQFPVDILKIDKSFVADVEYDTAAASIVAAMVALAHSLNCQVVAEGVETPGQLNFLRATQCDMVQGFYVSHPLSDAALEGFLSVA